MVTSIPASVNAIQLEKSASVRRGTGDGEWILPSFYAGPENHSLNALFEDAQISRLAELSPVVLFGGNGVGKTCLAVTLAVRWARLFNARSLSFIRGDQYASRYASAVEADDIQHFHSRLRRSTLMIIDDVDTIFSKPAAQQDLLFLLDILSAAPRPVIVTMQRLPSPDSGALPGLVSRLLGGLSIEVRPPSAATIEEMIRQLVKQIDSELPSMELIRAIGNDAAAFTAKNLAAFVTLASQHRKFNGHIDARILHNLALQVSNGTVPSIPIIAKAVAKRFGLKVAELRSATRQSKVVRARALAIVLSRKLTTLSLQDIGHFFGGRDHSTVLHSCRKIDKLLSSDAELAAAKHDVEIELQNRRTVFSEDEV